MKNQTKLDKLIVAFGCNLLFFIQCHIKTWHGSISWIIEFGCNFFMVNGAIVGWILTAKWVHIQIPPTGYVGLI